MKNNLFLGALLFSGVSAVSAQNLEVKQRHEINRDLTKAPFLQNIEAKALGRLVWHDNFDSITSIFPNDSTVYTPSAWVIDNDGETAANVGWTTDAAYQGWRFNGTGQWVFNSSSGGKFGEVNNGTTTAPVIGKVYTLTSPTIDIQALAGGNNVLLTFEQWGAKFYDSTSVAISIDGGTTWRVIYTNQHKDIHSANSSNIWANPEVVEVDLQDYLTTADNVQLRFSWTSEFPQETHPNAWVTYGWLIDDIKISLKADYDLLHVSSDYHVNGYKYTQIPFSQASEVSFNSVVKNQGSNPLTNIVLNVTDGTNSFSSAPLTLAVNAQDTLKASFTPSALGTYTFNQNITLDETDDNLGNNDNFTPVSFQVTNHTYAIDQNGPFTEYPLNSLTMNGNPVVIEGVGTSFDIFVDQVIYGMDFRLFTGTAANAEVYAELYEYNSTASQMADLWEGPLVESDLFILPSATPTAINKIYSLAFQTPYMLETGKTYLVLLRFAGTETVKVAASGTNTNRQSWLRHQGENVWGFFTQAAVVRANFDDSLSVNSLDGLFSEVTVFPNPAKDVATVEFNLASSSDVAINVTDVTGKVVSTTSLNNASVGFNAVDVKVADLATGVYTISIKSNDSLVTRKLVVE